MSWEIAWSEAAINDMMHLDRKLRQRVNKAIERLAETGYGDVKMLQGLSGYRLRVGNWRVRFARNNEARRVTIERVLPRSSAYR